MATGIMFLVMFGLMFLGVPIAVSIYIAMLVLIGMNPVTTTNFIAQTLYGGVASFTNLALPFFMICGTIMETGGLSKRLVRFANSLVGGITGSLGMVTVIACMFFGAVSGSAPATVAAIGSIMIPMMVSNGYNKYYATGLTCCAGGLGVIVPPSYPMVLYGVTCNVSVGKLFIAGLGPAFVVGGLLMLINYVMCKRWGIKGDTKLELKKHCFQLLGRQVGAHHARHHSGRHLLRHLHRYRSCRRGVCLWHRHRPVCSQRAEAGEAVGHLPRQRCLYRRYHVRHGPLQGHRSGLRLPEHHQDYCQLHVQHLHQPYIVLCMIFVIMFIVGMFVQTTPAIVILAPTLLAVVTQVGIDPIHFGIIMTLALAIAFVTPPVALNLFVGSSMTGLSIDKIVKAFMPFLIGLIVAFFIVSFVPAISLGVLGDWSLTFG